MPLFQDKSGVEEESATLLSALTEMLDSVEDDDGTLSPFDTLPDTELLTHPECRDNSVVGALSGTRNTSPKSTPLHCGGTSCGSPQTEKTHQPPRDDHNWLIESCFFRISILHYSLDKDEPHY